MHKLANVNPRARRNTQQEVYDARPTPNLIAKGSRSSKPIESGRNPGLVSPPAPRLSFKGPHVVLTLRPKGSNRKKTGDSVVVFWKL